MGTFTPADKIRRGIDWEEAFRIVENGGILGFDMATGRPVDAGKAKPGQIIAVQGFITENIRTGEIGTKGMLHIKIDGPESDEAGCR